MEVIIYDKITNKIKSVLDVLDIKSIRLKENEAVLNNKNIKDFNQSDIRVYNKDGSVKSLEKQVKEKIIILEKNQIIKDDNIYTLDKNNEEDLITLIENGVEKIDDYKKIITDENGKKRFIYKNEEELYKDGLMTKEAYNSHIIQMRQSEYQQNLDGARAELLEEVLVNLSEKGLLTDEELSKLEALNIKRQEIKDKYKKV